MGYSSLNSKDLDENGYALCCVCRKKKFCTDLETCSECDRWVCSSCRSYRRQSPFGYICKKCYLKSKKSS